MSSMVDDLLEVARLNSGTARWNWSELAAADSCGQALDSVRPLMDESQVKLLLNVEPAGLRMRGDADAVRRLVLNLVNNASKHTRAGLIHVQARPLSLGSANYIELEVADTGEGMSEETAARLGQAFALNSGVIGQSYVRGSGLGLAICRGIVAAHGGTITVASQPGKGTTVTAMLRADLPEPLQNTGDGGPIRTVML
jgi:signal transduction histidine kinase